MSTRTFSRYFATKESVILASIDEMAEVVAAHLVDVPSEINLLDALLIANTGMLASAKNNAGGMSAERILQMFRILASVDERPADRDVHRVHCDDARAGTPRLELLDPPRAP